MAVFLVAAAAVAGPLPARGASPHDFSTIGCTHCHIAVPGQSNLVPKRVFRKDISELCLGCHEDSKENQINHRTGIVPSMRVPEDLHLGARGEITCITCHMPHMPPQDKRSGGRTYFLRRPILKRELCLACHYEEKFAEPSSAFRIVAPAGNSIVKNLPVPLIGLVSDDLVKEVTVSINGTPIRLDVANRIFSTLLTLQEGLNSIKIEGKRARTASLELLYNPTLTEDLNYKLYYSHGILKKSDCKICHGEVVTPSIPIPDKVLCGKCHDPKNAKKYLHGPVAAGSCTVCHDPHGQTNRSFLIAESEKLCFGCHSEREVLLHFIDKSMSSSDLLRAKGCGFCHDPHQSERKYLLRKG